MCSYVELRQMKLTTIRKIINQSKNELTQIQKSPPNLVKIIVLYKTRLKRYYLVFKRMLLYYFVRF